MKEEALKNQTWYLSHISHIIYVEKKLPCGEFSAFCVWRLQGNKKFQMSSHDRCGKIWNSKHLVCVWCKKTSPYMQNLWYFLEKISFVKIYALCCKIRFVVIYALLCGEKFIQKFSMWRKNDKYQVWIGQSKANDSTSWATLEPMQVVPTDDQRNARGATWRWTSL